MTNITQMLVRLSILSGIVLFGALPARGQRRPETINVYAGEPDGFYWTWLQKITGAAERSLEGRYTFEFVATAGSVENYLSVRETAETIRKTDGTEGAPATAAAEARDAIALVQEDVAVFSAANDTRSSTGKRPVQALARPFTEYVYLVTARTAQSLTDVRRIDVGPAGSGSAFTFDRVRDALGDALKAEPVRVEASSRAQAGPQVDALFRLTRSPRWKDWGVGPEGTRQVLGFAPALLNQVQLAAPVFHRASVADPQQAAPVTTLAVDAILVANSALPAEVGEAIVKAIANEHGLGLERMNEATVDGRRSMFRDMQLPEHPGLIRAQRGRYPYLDIATALFFVGTLMLLHLWTRRGGRMTRWVEAYEWPTFWADRHVGYALAVLLGSAVWTLTAALLIKFFEVRPLLAGLGGDDSGLWRMNLSEMLSWMFVMAIVGHDQGIFPVTPQGQWLAVSIQVVSYGGLLYVLGSVSLKFIEDVVKRYVQPEVYVKHSDHLVICNWTPSADVILQEFRRTGSGHIDGHLRPVVVVGESIDPNLSQVHKNLFLVDGSPHDPTTLDRACVDRAWAVIILRSVTDAAKSDALSAMTAIDVRERSNATGTHQPRIVAEILDADCGHDLAILDGMQDVGTERSFEVALLAQTAVTRRISHFYDALLHNSEDSVELYTLPVPSWLRGRELRFGEVIRRVYFASTERSPDNPVIVVGIRRGLQHRVDLNPRRRDHDGIRLTDNDDLVVISYQRPEAETFESPPASLVEADTSYMTPSGRIRQIRTEPPATGEMGQGLRGHVVICNWHEEGEDLLSELQNARSVAHARAPVLIVADQPVKFHDGDVFDGVQVVPMNPYSPKAMERAQVSRAHSVLILADRRLEDPDGRTLLLALRLNALLRERRREAEAAGLKFIRPNIAAEVVDPRNVGYLRQAGKGVDEPICAKEMLYRLFAQAVGNPDMVPVFHELLRASSDTNEVYLEAVPVHLVERNATFAQALDEYARHRSPQNPAIPLGFRRPDLSLVINPRADGRGHQNESLTADHRLLVMQYERRIHVVAGAAQGSGSAAPAAEPRGPATVAKA